MQTYSTTGSSINRKVSVRNFYAYRIVIRRTSSNHILKCLQLFLYFIADIYAKIESDLLPYARLNQRKLRGHDFIHLRDAVASDGNGNVSHIERLVLLPARLQEVQHVQEYAQDAMLYVRTCGHPELFITFTCNPDWNKINED